VNVPTGTILIAHALSTCFMTGLIWFVQVVHYPLMALIGEAGYERYQLAHQRLTSLVVGPVMLLEAASALVLLLRASQSGEAFRAMAYGGVGLLALVWLSTFAVQVPLHERLSRGFDARVHRRLVHTNWVRTFAWSARGLLSLIMLAGAAG